MNNRSQVRSNYAKRRNALETCKIHDFCHLWASINNVRNGTGSVR